LADALVSADLIGWLYSSARRQPNPEISRKASGGDRFYGG
jgi:hypothetical protein